MTDAEGSGRLDPAADPDRFVAEPAPTRSVSPDARSLDPRHDPDRFSHAVEGEPPAAGALDPRHDPDRFANAGGPEGKDLTELIGKARSFEEERSPYTWLLGLAMVLGFLAVVSLIFANLSPR